MTLALNSASEKQALAITTNLTATAPHTWPMNPNNKPHRLTHKLTWKTLLNAKERFFLVTWVKVVGLGLRHSNLALLIRVEMEQIHLNKLNPPIGGFFILNVSV
jgi:hypothetical protein